MSDQLGIETVRRSARIAAFSFLLLGSAVGAALLVPIDSGQDLVRLRNSLLIEVAENGVFDWQPDALPPSFQVERLSPPATLVAIDEKVLDSDRSLGAWNNALALARHLVANRRRPGLPIQSNTEDAYRKITESGLGYCADYTQVFGALAMTAGLKVREWGMSFDGYSGDGHAFNEIFDPDRREWAFIDTFHSFYVVDQTGEPVSVTELRDSLEASSANLRVVPIDPHQFFFDPGEALEYYAQGMQSLFMVWGNNVFTYEDHPAIRLAARLSRSVEQLTAIVTGVQPRLIVERGRLNERGLAELSRLRLLLYMATSSFLVGIVCLTVVLFMRPRAKRNTA